MSDTHGERHDRVEDVLAGRVRYDDVDRDTQALVRAAWDRRVEERRASLDFTEEFIEAGTPWAEADPQGNLVMKYPEIERQKLMNRRALAALIEEFGALSRKHIDALGDTPLVHVEVDGRTVYPAFQLTPDGQVHSLVRDILTMFAGLLSDEEVALWFTGSNGYLGGARPVDLLDSYPDEVVAAVRGLSMDLGRGLD